jgi:hypothetical protein
MALQRATGWELKDKRDAAVASVSRTLSDRIVIVSGVPLSYGSCLNPSSPVVRARVTHEGDEASSAFGEVARRLLRQGLRQVW